MPELKIIDDSRLSSAAIEETGTDDFTAEEITGDRDFEIQQIQIEKPTATVMTVSLEHIVDGITTTSRLFEAGAGVIDAFYLENRHLGVQKGSARILVTTTGNVNGNKRVVVVGARVDS